MGHSAGSVPLQPYVLPSDAVITAVDEKTWSVRYDPLLASTLPCVRFLLADREAVCDPTTGVWTVRSGSSILPMQYAPCRRLGAPYGMVLFGLDRPSGVVEARTVTGALQWFGVRYDGDGTEVFEPLKQPVIDLAAYRGFAYTPTTAAGCTTGTPIQLPAHAFTLTYR
jgi:hypothetical protein